jgi:hypothetical protein
MDVYVKALLQGAGVHMQKGLLKGLFCSFLGLTLMALPAHGEAESGNLQTFRSDRISLQVMAGVLYSPFTPPFSTPRCLQTVGSIQHPPTELLSTRRKQTLEPWNPESLSPN